jgi:hypothetical protein
MDARDVVPGTSRSPFDISHDRSLIAVVSQLSVRYGRTPLETPTPTPLTPASLANDISRWNRLHGRAPHGPIRPWLPSP